MTLAAKKCIPCEGGIPLLSDTEINEKLDELNDKWILDGYKIQRSFSFVNFKQTMTFVNNVADLAEQEGHHPVMLVEYGKCQITLWTHAINGLSENDFILAAKIDELNL